ncbi:MAG: hypothetical protein IPL40_14370 [Proteobacteria bacterium]|nr:hypothetical protein [Pseudomonadota bacterium]
MSRIPSSTRVVTRVVLLLALATPLRDAAGAPGPKRDERDVLREASSVASAVMSPFCPGRTLSACPSPRAGEWRVDIRNWVAAGVPREQIVQRLQARTPEINLTSDRNPLYGWIAPALALLAMSGLVLGVGRRLLRHGRRAGSATPIDRLPDLATGTTSVLDPTGADATRAAYAELLDDELRRE